MPGLRRPDQEGVRLDAILSRGLLLAALAAPAAAGPVRLEIETAETPRDPFVVTVTGHYADLHNGHSRTWKRALVPAGGAQWLPLGPVNLVLNMGVSLRVYHPEYVAESQRSRKTPLLVRPVVFEPFRPRAWRDVMAEWPTDVTRRVEHPLFAVLGHLQSIHQIWLPAMDVEGSATDAQLRTYLPFLDELLAFAESAGPAPRDTTMTFDTPEKRRAYERSLANQELETRADAAELVRRAHAWLSLPRAQRASLRTVMEDMRSPKGLGERLMSERDLAELGAFLDRYTAARAARRDPQTRVSWTHPETRITYRVSVLDPPRGCAYVAVTTDLTRVVDVDLGDMTHDVKARFCQRASGEWRYGRS
jgi:hypothetical protein